MLIFFLSLLSCISVSLSQRNAQVLSTIVSPPEVVGGPECCKFDSPFMAIQNLQNITIGYTANAQTYVWSKGNTVSDTLNKAIFTGLGPDSSNVSFSHCGKWLNSAWMDNKGIIHGYFHQEWNCDYARGLYTNKSVAYAVSNDGGMTFVSTPQPGPGNEANANLLISGHNFSEIHQTGEGDHGVVQFGDWLYMYFIEWDGISSIHGGTTASIARSALSDAGRPGTWWKYLKGSFNSPGVGGACDVVDIPGTAVYYVPDVKLLVSVGVIFSAPLNVAWSSNGLDWTPSAAGPMFTADWSNWNRDKNSGELFGYPALTGSYGTSKGLPTENSFVYFTYLDPGTDFNHRWLVRRQLRIVSGVTTAPIALAALSLWTARPLHIVWPTTGPVSPASGYNITQASLAYLATWAPTAPSPSLHAIQECQLKPGPPAIVALTLDGECGVGTFSKWKRLRTSGWIASSSHDAESLGWTQVERLGSSNVKITANAAQLWRCISGPANYSVAFNTACSGGYLPDILLGYAFTTPQ